MQITTYSGGKILLPKAIRSKYDIADHSELILIECSDGIKITTRKLLLESMREELKNRDVLLELRQLRDEEFKKELEDESK